MTLQLVILASGRGSNAEAIIKAIEHQELDAQILAVISNKPDAAVLDMAEQHHIPALAIPSKGLSREAHEALLIDALQELKADYIILAGYMRLFTPQFINAFPQNIIINIHPSLLPEFKGAHAYQDAWDANVLESGISIHYVTEAMDEGPIICQRRFPRLPNDTFETFQQRGLSLEHQLYPKVLQQLAIEKTGHVLEGEKKQCLPV